MKDLATIRELVKEDLAAVDQAIISFLETTHPFVDQLSRHIVAGGGKRIRPLIVILGAKAFNYEGDAHIHLAAAMELFHNATLLHDDVIDESQLRHGAKTANNIWGNKASILVGDFLFTRSFQIMVKTNHSQILQVLANASNNITQGEVLQLINCNNPQTTETQYMDIIKKKTATLFSAAAQLGAILANRSSDEINTMEQFGLHLGTAFQIIDDALDYCAETKTMGKNIGGDLADGKPTLPLIKALQLATGEQQMMIHHAITHGDTQNLDAIILAIKECKAIDYTYGIATKQIKTASALLEQIPTSIYRDALQDLAHFAIQRQH